ncbi:hypothetical protein [Sutcliffiella rhizosphaerae]|uniref:Uncharacterized protein n=1 Tax=Sutcliffiella rhizosphaerae TaxID=2880967 RepID=A0ABN8AD44_9BACI|nr:hypothetical protein [Sutcliffiella rhizosphaerae]CAG9621382.1 hypothetical protein BACCIP111883_02155 [Sutcliffiella rhizosphaerae]
MGYQLMSVNFYPSKVNKWEDESKYVVYVKHAKSYSEQRLSFFDAIELCKEEATSQKENWYSISIMSNQAVELHFRSISNKLIIAVTIDLSCYHLDISSYVWYQHRKAFLKVNSPEKINHDVVEMLLKRILIKHDGKTAFLTLNESKGTAFISRK